MKMLLKIMGIWTLLHLSLPARIETETGDYCLTETFRASCLNDEVIFMTSATYGRMRVGRCVTAEEVDVHKAVVGDDPRYLGCSTDVLQKLDQKCSRKTDCEFRVYDILDENIQPCVPGLKMYLEAGYKCINVVVDDHRSCVVTASKDPTHIIDHSVNQRICGTKSQPWIVDVPLGQKIRISVLEFLGLNSGRVRGSKPSCQGLIVDETGKRNASICISGGQREKELYVSTGNQVKIFLNPLEPKRQDEEQTQFLLKLEALGCSDIIPPDEAWLKRNDDSIVIGCYSSRQTWRLNCLGGKWSGVLGNCSHDTTAPDLFDRPDLRSPLSSKAQVLAIVAIVGFTVTICLAIICTGAVCLRRFYAKVKKTQDYKTLNYDTNGARNQHQGQRFISGASFEYCVDDGQRLKAQQQIPTYSVAVDERDSDNYSRGAENPIPAARI